MKTITNKIFNWIIYIILLGIYIVFVMGAITFIKWSLFKIGII